MAVRIRLPGGTLKIKTFRELRHSERERLVPVRKLGRLYLTWWRAGQGERPSAHRATRP